MKEYFKHDYGASRDEAIRILIAEHGVKAYGLYWILVEELYSYVGRMSLACTSLVLRSSSLRTAQQMFDRMVELGLFEVNDGLVSSTRVDKELTARKGVSETAKENANKRWSKDAGALPSQSQRNAIREEKSIVYTPLTPQGGDVRVSTEIPTPTTEEEKIEARLHVAKKYAPSVDDVVTYGLSRGIPQAEMIEFWDWHDQRGWTLSDGKPVVKWRVRFDSWMRKKGLMP